MADRLKGMTRLLGRFGAAQKSEEAHGDQDAAAFVLAYLRARHDWEVRSHAELERGERSASVSTAVKAIQSEYEALVARFCTPRIVDARLRFSFGHPPDIDPKRTKIRAVHGDRERTVVTTLEDVERGAKPREYEYVLEASGDRWLLANRRTRDLGGSWIDRVL